MNYVYEMGISGFIIIEKSTNMAIEGRARGSNDEARRIVHRLNQGGGFNGHTPPFFCSKIPKNEFA